jgi:nucleotide-binding universal stress UspA family protein
MLLPFFGTFENTKMKYWSLTMVLLCSDAALDALRRAGLPCEVEAVVLSVADVYLPPLPPAEEKRARTVLDEQTAAARQKAREQAEQAVEDARLLATRASARVQTLFPAWNVRVEAGADSPAWGIIKKVDEWQPDLVVVGTHGHSALGRFLLGAVYHKSAYRSTLHGTHRTWWCRRKHISSAPRYRRGRLT